MRDFTLGMVTMNVAKGENAAMLDRIAAFAGRARERGVDLLVFPEYAISGYVKDRSRYPAIASRKDGEDLDRLGGIAREHGLAISAGFIESSDGAFYNAQALFDRGGRRVGIHRKCNLSPGETPYLAAGTSYPVFDLGFCRVGYNVCFEAWFPESQRILTLQDVELILMPFAFHEWWERHNVNNGAKSREDVLAMRRGRLNKIFQGASLLNTVFMAYVDHCGRENEGDSEGRETYPGICMAWDPAGELLAQSPGYVEGMTTVRLSAAVLEEWRKNDHYPLHWRRPSLYRSLCDSLSEGDIEFQKDYYRAHNREYLERFDRAP